MGISSKMARAALISGAGRLFGRRRLHILIACTPKSASSFLAHAFEGIPGVIRLRASQPGYRQDMVLDPIQLGQNAFKTYVIKRHVRYNRATARCIDDFGMTPVVLTRDLADSVASMRDFIRDGNYRMPMAWFDESHMAMDDDDLELTIVDLAMPWYLNFLMGWRTCKNAIWFDYDEVREDPVVVMERIADAAGLRVDRAAIEAGIQASTKSRPAFNKGVSGRGKSLSEKARARLRALSAHYPELGHSALQRGALDTAFQSQLQTGTAP